MNAPISGNNVGGRHMSAPYVMALLFVFHQYYVRDK